MKLSEHSDVFAPIFIVGVQRSGTTLLRTILHAHPDLCIGYECAFYKKMAKVYGDGISPRDAESFLDDLLAVRRFDLWGLDRKELHTAVFGTETYKEKQTIPYVKALRHIAAFYLKKEKPQATLFEFKNPNGIYHLDFIFDLFPNARILHMVRDPRGVLNSEKKKQIQTGSYQSSDMIWTVARRHRKMVHIAEAYKSDPRYLAIQYSDLVIDFESTLEKILDFLDLELKDRVRDYHLVARDGGFTPQKELWQHGKSLDRPDPTRVNMFQTELSLKEISTIEMLCGRTLNKSSAEHRYGSFLEGAIGLGQVLLHKISQRARGQKCTSPPKSEPLDSGMR